MAPPKLQPQVVSPSTSLSITRTGELHKLELAITVLRRRLIPITVEVDRIQRIIDAVEEDIKSIAF